MGARRAGAAAIAVVHKVVHAVDNFVVVGRGITPPHSEPITDRTWRTGKVVHSWTKNSAS